MNDSRRNPTPASGRTSRRPSFWRLIVAPYRRYRPWITSPDRINEILPGRTGSLLSAVGWLFCRESTLLIFSFTFAFLLSIFPLIVLLLSLTSPLYLAGFRETMLVALQHFFPVSQEWIVRNLEIYINEVGIYQVISLILLAWAGSALFFALEAALESAYRVKYPRNFVGSQIRGTVLVVALGILALTAAAVLHWGVWLAVYLLPPWIPERHIFLLAYYGVAFVVVVCLMSCAFYWLPNRNVPFRKVLPESIFASVLIIIADLVFRWLAPDLRLEEVYGPFYVSVTILLWGYTFGCIIVGSARLGATGFFLAEQRPDRDAPESGDIEPGPVPERKFGTPTIPDNSRANSARIRDTHHSRSNSGHPPFPITPARIRREFGTPTIPDNSGNWWVS